MKKHWLSTTALWVVGIVSILACATPPNDETIIVRADFSWAPESPVEGQSVTFEAVASPPNPNYVYAWDFNGDGRYDALGKTVHYTFAYPGSPDVRLRASLGVLDDSPFDVASKTLRVRPAAANDPPTISAQPQSLAVATGAAASFSVVAEGTAPLRYQWQRDGADVAGATSASFSLPAVQPADNGASFRVMVRNDYGSETSEAALLTVTGAQSRTWQSDGALNVTAPSVAAVVTEPEVAMGTNEIPVAAFAEGDRLVVRELRGSWASLGTAPGTFRVLAASLTIDASGAPIVAWQETESANSESSDVYAARWNGSAWTVLGGGPADVAVANDATAPCIRARSGDLVMAWVELGSSGDSRIVVRLWNGSNWVDAGQTHGPAPVPGSRNDSPKLAVSASDGLAVSWVEGALQVRVAELLGQAWTATANLPASGSGAAFMHDIAYSTADGLLVVRKQSGATGTFSVERWSAGAWSNLGSALGGASFNGVPQIFGLSFSHARGGSAPLLAYSRRTQAGPVHEFVVERFNRALAQADWELLGNPLPAVGRNGRGGFEGAVAVTDGATPRVATFVRGSLDSGAADLSLVGHRYQ